MEYIVINIPPYPYFVYSGDALYRQGDFHRKRAGIDSFDLLFVEEGGLYMKVENNSFHVKENDVLIIPKGKSHQSYKVCDKKTYFHWLHFSTAETFMLSNSFIGKNEKTRKPVPGKSHKDTLILPIFQTIPSNEVSDLIQIINNLESLRVNKYIKSSLVSKESDPGTPIRNQVHFFNLLSLLIIGDEQAGGPDIASMLMHYLQTDYSTKISLEDMAKTANCHPTHVIRCFNKKYQTTPIKALINIRLQKAKELLRTTNLSCEDIAYRVGFSSASYFSKLFKERNMITPQEYRNNTQYPFDEGRLA